MNPFETLEMYQYVIIYFVVVIICIGVGFCMGEIKYKKNKNTIIVNRVSVRPKEGFNSIPEAWANL
mgnify:FL=1|jgi:hypothetical protein